ncbi:MAG TPA: hypothetical protein VI451_06050 [Anaerolineales bacterium]|nr:hypothetical protein [Anaerolineales bacterium]
MNDILRRRIEGPNAERNSLGLSTEEANYFLKDRSTDEIAVREAFNPEDVFCLSIFIVM